jgi:hypothetical protein
MGFIGRKNRRKQSAAAEQKAAEAMHQRALGLVDTQGVLLRAAEAELQAAVSELRAYATPERERRFADAKARVAEARRALEEARSSGQIAA